MSVLVSPARAKGAGGRVRIRGARFDAASGEWGMKNARNGAT